MSLKRLLELQFKEYLDLFLRCYDITLIILETLSFL